MVSKPKLLSRLFLESQDENYDREDRTRYRRIRKIVNSIPHKQLSKILQNYEYYRGFCYGLKKSKNKMLNETEYNILMSVIENIENNYYDWRN